MAERTYGKLEWMFYIIILPLLFTGLILGLVLQFMGYNVTGKLMSVARQTPVISSIVPPDEATKKERSEVRKLTTELDETKKAFEKTQQTNDLLNQDLVTKESAIDKLKKEIEQLNKQESDQQSTDVYWKKQAEVYSEMSSKKAADILSSVPLQEAKAILGRMSLDIKAAILEKMDSKIAALLESDTGNTNENDRRSAQDHLKVNSNVYSQMSPEKAAGILSELPVEQAKAILNGLSTEVKASILEKMDPKKAAERI